MTPAEITVEELASRRAAGDGLVVLDVREPDELAAAALAGTIAIPMREVPLRESELPRDRPLAVLCHHGSRSDRVARWLRAHGFDATNIAGGIDAWSVRIDPAVPRY